MPTILLTIAYDGTHYSGWQIQPNGLAVQQVVEEAMEKLLGEKILLRSSGRTDAGVHARGMPAAFFTERDLPLRAYIEGCNRYLPDDIAVISARTVVDSFKPIKDALRKHYRYTILCSTVRSPLDRHYTWLVRDPLDIAAMRTAADHFAGRHDFAAFRASNCVAKTTVRHIDSVEISTDGPYVIIDVVGEGFLKNMVRVMAGTLTDIGRGRFSPEHIIRLLENGDRKKAGVTAPASGLCLMSVCYPE